MKIAFSSESHSVCSDMMDESNGKFKDVVVYFDFMLTELFVV